MFWGTIHIFIDRVWFKFNKLMASVLTVKWEFVLNLNKSQEKYVQSLECKLPFLSWLLFQVQSGKDSVPRRKAPGIPVNKDTPVRKFGKNQWEYVREYFNLKLLFNKASQKRAQLLSWLCLFVLFCCMWVCVLAPVRTSPPPPAGEVVKYSSQFSDHIIPSQDVQGNWIRNCCYQEYPLHNMNELWLIM